MANGVNALDPKIVRAISQQCLNGQAVPSGLGQLWLAKSRGDNFLADGLGIELLTSIGLLDAGYGEEIAQGDETILANVRAHRRVFNRIGFFAACDEYGCQLAFDFVSDPVDPPIVRLDSEGQYDWQGASLAEAILRFGEDLGVEETGQWLTNIGLPVMPLVEFGASTQFLPSIGDLHERFYNEESGTQKKLFPSGRKSAESNDPTTWVLRPGKEVRLALSQLLRLSADESPPRQWVQCDSEGRVCTVWFHPVPETMQIAVSGVMFGMSAAQTTKVLGKPAKTGDGWLSFSNAAGRLRVGFKDDRLNEICLMAE